MKKVLNYCGRTVFWGLVGGVLFFGSSCTYTAINEPQSHFSYPNSNITPVGHVSGKKGKMCGIMGIPIGSIGVKDLDVAIDEAIDEKGGDILINYRSSTTYVPLVVVTTCSVKVEGTAAKMEIGKQRLH